MGKAIIKAFIGLAAIIAFPFIVLGVAIGATILTVRAVLAFEVKKAPVLVPAAIKETGDATITAPINWNTVPVGRMDKGGQC